MNELLNANGPPEDAALGRTNDYYGVYSLTCGDHVQTNVSFYPDYYYNAWQTAISNPYQHFAGFYSTLVYAQGLSGTGEGVELTLDDAFLGRSRVDLRPGVASSLPENITSFGWASLFSASDGVTGIQPYQTDGRAEGTARFADIGPGADLAFPGQYTAFVGKSSPFPSVGKPIYFFIATRPGVGYEPYISDGTEAGTRLVQDINPGPANSFPSNSVGVSWLDDIALLMQATSADHGAELWSVRPNGTAFEIKDIAPGAAGAEPRNFTFLLPPLTNTPAKPFIVFSADDGASGRELWKTDGTATGTAPIIDLAPGAASSEPYGLTAYQAALEFFLSSGRKHEIAFGATVQETGTELYATDGTAAGTRLVKDINPGAASSTPFVISASGGLLLFGADDGVHGTELWRSDGTADGTFLLKDINPTGSGMSMFWGTIPISINGVLYFQGEDGETGREVWKTDGTPEGTVRISDVNPGAGGSNPVNFARAGATLLFHASPDGGTTFNLYQYSDLGLTLKDTNVNTSGGIGVQFATVVPFLTTATTQTVGALVDPSVLKGWGVLADAVGPDWRPVGLGEVTPGLSGPELFLQNAIDGVIVFKSQDTGWHSVPGGLKDTIGAAFDWRLVAIGDTDGDGSANIVIQDQATKTIFVGALSHDASFGGWRELTGALKQTGAANFDCDVVGVGDFNGDGRADIAVQDAVSRSILWLDPMLATPDKAWGWHTASQSLDADWTAIGVGDVTGDGRAEIVIQNAVSGDTLAHDPSLGAEAWQVITTAIDAFWRADGLADIDQDGYAEVLFRHVATGETLAEHWTGTSADAWSQVTAPMGGDWQLLA